jgi:hypothetical protein
LAVLGELIAEIFWGKLENEVQHMQMVALQLVLELDLLFVPCIREHGIMGLVEHSRLIEPAPITVNLILDKHLIHQVHANHRDHLLHHLLISAEVLQVFAEQDQQGVATQG